MKVVGLSSLNASKTGKAEFVLPVPMGSPQNYYGVGYFIDPVTTVTPSTSQGTPVTIAAKTPGVAAPASGAWSSSSGTVLAASQSSGTPYIYSTTNGQQQTFTTFGIAVPAPADADHPVVITGLRVLLNGAYVSAACASTTIAADLSWNTGGSWSTLVPSIALTTAATNLVLGSSTTTSAWGLRNWSGSEFADSKFQVRLTANKGCLTAGTQVKLDQLQVEVRYRIDTITYSSSTVLTPTNITAPDGSALAPQKFWAGMQSQGAPSIQGDAYMTKYDTRTTSTNSAYDPAAYYNYGVDIPTGSNNGELWIFDPGFCDGTSAAGTGETWTVGAPNGNSTRQPISSFFDLYDTKSTPYDYADDVPVFSSNNTFQNMSGQDSEAFAGAGSGTTGGIADCSATSWHYNWYQLASGLPAGAYRLHTHSNDTDQDDSTGLNAFAFWAKASGGSPRIYGLGAMEAYVRLPGGQVSEFYLAQIDAVHAGKTMEIKLWDPGDTGNLSANLQILQPGTLSPIAFAYQGTPASSSATGCAGQSSASATTVTTNTGGTSLYNGCWLTMTIVIPANYTAPADPTFPAEKGWWKIRYTMGNGGSGYATDLTTWQVGIKGNPVHLLVP
jgi:hypothetical protein